MFTETKATLKLKPYTALFFSPKRLISCPTFHLEGNDSKYIQLVRVVQLTNFSALAAPIVYSRMQLVVFVHAFW